ncbi:MAG TPA: hypothetical protein VF491_06435, partial [Vicinamibacterales bacterium]
TNGSTEVWMLPVTPALSLRLEDGWVSRSYGVKSASTVIVFEQDAELPFSLSYIFAGARLDSHARTGAIAALERAASSSKGE